MSFGQRRYISLYGDMIQNLEILLLDTFKLLHHLSLVVPKNAALFHLLV